MYKVENEQDAERRLNYMVLAVEDLLRTEKDLIANLSNISAFIKEYMDCLNWAGFYLMKEGELILGPFQGKPACIRIKAGAGVCGTAAAAKKIMVVDDVHAFPGHIACDAASQSEIVLPIYKGDAVFGVIDLDSPEKARFSKLDRKYLEKMAQLITDYLNKSV